MQLSGLALGLASEGSFGADPFAGIFPWNVEFLIFIDVVYATSLKKTSCIQNHEIMCFVM